MRNIGLVFLFFFTLHPKSWSQTIVETEPPHIFLEGNKARLLWIEQGERKEATETTDHPEHSIRLLGFSPYTHFQYTLSDAYHETYHFPNVDKFVALSDVHGQYETMRHFLQTFGVIDENNQWSYGKGHLVILGDLFDRGPQVTETVWLAFKLEMQALQAGGRVHYLAGNHESMVLYNDLRYVHARYPEAAQVMGLELKNWFTGSSLLGQWLRRRPIMLTINDNLLVHGGLSPLLLEQKFTIEEVNTVFRTEFFTYDSLVSIENKRLDMLRFTNGPLWYRGFFNDQGNPIKEAKEALSYFGKNRILIGHTSGDHVRTLLDQQVIAIDSYLQGGKNGEILLFENNKFFRGLRNGEKIPLFQR
jgi:hypothetical protein